MMKRVKIVSGSVGKMEEGPLEEKAVVASLTSAEAVLQLDGFEDRPP